LINDFGDLLDNNQPPSFTAATEDMYQIKPTLTNLRERPERVFCRLPLALDTFALLCLLLSHTSIWAPGTNLLSELPPHLKWFFTHQSNDNHHHRS
jgi:hypothetical protein